MNKRVVLITTKGPHAGLHTILGTVDQLKAGLHTMELPTFVNPVNFIDHQGSCSLIRATERYVLYRETITPSESNKAFHPEQQ